MDGFAAAVAAVAPALDAELCAYLGGILADDPPPTAAALAAALADLLLGYEVAADEAGAAAACERLFAALVARGLCGAGAAAAGADEPRLLSQPVVIAAARGQDYVNPLGSQVGALQLGQNLMRNAAIAATGEDVSAINTKAKARRAAKEAAAAAAAAWDPEANALAVRDALDIYLQARNSASTKDLLVSDFTLLYPGKTEPLIEKSNLHIVAGRRYGLIGRNGSGKTTLMRALATYAIEGMPCHLKIFLSQQEVSASEQSVLEAVIGSNLELQVMTEEQRDLEAVIEAGAAQEPSDAIVRAQARLAQVADRLRDLDAFGAEGRARRILTGLGFTPDMMVGATKQLSGGWRMRTALAGALFAEADVLLLDEPSNHLDFQAIQWLEQFIPTLSGTLIVVSHDRNFLDNVCTDIIYLHNKKLDYYAGDYSNFVKVAEEDFKAKLRAYEAQQMEIAHIESFIYTFYHEKRSSAQNARTTQAMSRKRTLEKMVRLPDPRLDVDPDAAKLRFPEPAAARRPVLIQADHVSFKFPRHERMLLEDVNVQIAPGSRIAVVGVNGAGKSTLLRLLIGELAPTQGNVTQYGPRVAFFSQHNVDNLSLDRSPMQLLSEQTGMSEQEARNALGGFGIAGTLATSPCGVLSGGQKSRVVFTLLSHKAPSLLILDEPTNFLDMATIDSLIEALDAFGGASLVVSHDLYFLRKVVKEFWAVAHNRVTVCHTFEEAKKMAY